MSDFLAWPYHRFLRIKLVQVKPGYAEIRLPFRSELQRVDGSDWINGGVVATLTDIAGAAAMCSATNVDAPTIDMRIDYLRPSKGDLTASAEAVKTGKRIAVADIEVRDSDANIVAIGRAVYAIQRQVPLAEQDNETRRRPE